MREFVVLDFACAAPEYGPELRRLAASGTVRILDTLLVHKTESGAVEIADPRGWAGGLAGLIGEEDVDDVAAELAPGHTAVVLLLDHACEGGVRAALRETGGRVVLATPAIGFA